MKKPQYMPILEINKAYVTTKRRNSIISLSKISLPDAVNFPFPETISSYIDHFGIYSLFLQWTHRREVLSRIG